MMQSIDAERQMVREVELKTLQRRKYLISTVVLALLSTGLLAGLITLSVVHIRHLQECSTTIADTSSSPGDLSSTPGPIGPIGLPEAPPLMSKRRIVVVPVSARRENHYPRPTGTGTNSNSTFSSSNNKGTCEVGNLYGGRQLDQLDHDAYMPLMQKALSLSPAAQSGDVRNFYHASLRSVFRCVDGGESVGVGGIELVAACRGGFVVSGGGEVECDGDGSYEGGSETSGSAPASPSSGSPYAGI